MQLELAADPTAEHFADDERRLVEAARNDPRAFAAVYQAHYQPLANYLFHRTGDRHATEDLLSEVFLQVIRRLSLYRWSGIPLRFWLLRIATNAANRWARRRRREGQIMGALRTDLARGVTTRAPAGETSDSVQMALARLSPPQQAVIALHYLEGFRVEDTARILGCRVGTVKSRLARARDELRGMLGNKENDNVRTD